MPARIVALPAAPSTLAPTTLAEALAELRSRLEIPDDFPADVAAAAAAAAEAARLPDLDRTDLELITIDPPGAQDLDQALHLARSDGGYLVSYAIADVAAFVTSGDPVDLEARRRGLTLYAPDTRSRLHPAVLSEGAASLLPEVTRPALLWSLRLDDAGELLETDVRRALVRSREQLSYEQAQAELDGGQPRETLALLVEVGRLREERERDRGGVSLQIPSQEIQVDAAGRYSLTYRATLAVEDYNAQISLLTGAAAARLMLDGRIGILRTLPPADPGALRRLRRTARALQIAWPDDQDYPEFVRSLDPAVPAHAAMLNACTELFRGAGYEAFDGERPEHSRHAALAIEYAHVTAPLRRLVDRFTGEVCVALCAGEPVPDWTRSALPGLPDLMAAAESRAKKYERAIIDLVEVSLLHDRVGDTFTGSVIDIESDGRKGVVMVADPAVQGRVRGDQLLLGSEVRLRLTSADWESGRVEFEVV
ncbi:MAG TPA: RNB domain-containing ribonuclease [Microlunatus sp.]|nr:RNB domain-containing ribonuclease [Microlunatus sp.]